MSGIPVPEAARALSMSAVSTYEAMKAGRLEQVPGAYPARVTAASVQALAAERREDAKRRHSDLCSYAREVVERLHPNHNPGSSFMPPPRGRAALKNLPADVFALFGRDVVEAAASRDRLHESGACPTCWAYASARIHQTQPPRDEAPFKILLGQPCPKDQQRWAVDREARHREAVRLRLAEQARQKQAAEAAARHELEAARAGVSAAASRFRSATAAYGSMHPEIAREAATRARARGSFTLQPQPRKSRVPEWCDCNADHQCTTHIEMDREAAAKARRARGRR